MRILIYGINYAPELVGVGKYTGEMGDWLAAKGHKVRVITSPPYYPNWQVWPNFSKWFYCNNISINLLVWRCPLYVPTRPVAILRILHLLSFAFTSMPILMMQIFWVPKIIFLISPTLICAPQTLLLAKITGAKSVLHIQDFEVDAFLGLDLAESGSRSVILRRILFSFESLILKSFSLVSTISSGMMSRAIDKGVIPENLRFLPNWSEIDRFQNVKPSEELMQRLGVVGHKRIILYSGSMGEKQGLENVLLAAQNLQTTSDLVFLLVGEGSYKNRLINMALDMKLNNVIFSPLQSYENLPYLLASADVHLVIQRRDVADAVLPSKLSNILAIGGNVVITCDISTTLGKLALDHPGIAIVVEPESVNALIGGIEQGLSMTRPNSIAQTYAQKFLDKEEVLSRFFTEFDTYA